jgi:ubiquinone/menaquinone biosynthesis C-methylase UbiE
LKIEEVVARLGLGPGDRVADIGAGRGVFFEPLAWAEAPGETLYAVETDQELFDYINDRAGRENLANIQTVLAEFEDPKLPSREFDLIFFHDVLHHIEKRQEYLKPAAFYLKLDGRIVVIDMIKGHPEAGHRNQPEMQISPEEVKQWMAAAGLRLVEEADDLFENKFFVAFVAYER